MHLGIELPTRHGYGPLRNVTEHEGRLRRRGSSLVRRQALRARTFVAGGERCRQMAGTVADARTKRPEARIGSTPRSPSDAEGAAFRLINLPSCRKLAAAANELCISRDSRRLNCFPAIQPDPLPDPSCVFVRIMCLPPLDKRVPQQ